MDEDVSALVEAEVETLIAERLQALVRTLEGNGLKRETIMAGLSLGLDLLRQGVPQVRLGN